MMNALETRFFETLRKNNVRCTAPRTEIFAILQEANEPLAFKEITAKVKNADRASVYRTLALFETLHIVSTILAGWKKRFELAAPYKNHHHHISCEQCGKVISVESPTLEKVIKSISEQKGFHLHSHTLELSGCCNDCRKLM